MAEWIEKLETIKQAQTEIMRRAPFKDFGLVPNPGAASSAISAAEQRLGYRLPASYREFLRRHDGWPRFYEGATLLGTSSLGLRKYESMAEAVFRASETPVPDVGPPSGFRSRRPLIPFGMDLQGTTVFCFDPGHSAQADELPIIAWVNEVGVTFANFEAFLDGIIEWLSLDHEFDSFEMSATG